MPASRPPGRARGIGEAFLRAAPTRLAAAVALLALLVPAAARGAEEPSTRNYESKLDAIRPPVEGLEAKTEGGDRYLVLANETGKTVFVPGYDNEPYLRFLASGEVQANANSPARYLNEIRFGTPDSVTIPVSALAGAEPRWERVSDDGSYRWFDHRIHWMEEQPPPIVKDESKRTKIFDWKVPARVGNKPVTLAGTLAWVPSSSSSSGLSAGAIAAIAAGALVLVALAVLLLRRRRGRSAPSPGKERPAEEAW